MLLLKFSVYNPTTGKVFYNFLKYLLFGMKLLILVLLFEPWQTPLARCFPLTSLKVCRYSVPGIAQSSSMCALVHMPTYQSDVIPKHQTQSLGHRNRPGTKTMSSQRAPVTVAMGNITWNFLKSHCKKTFDRVALIRGVGFAPFRHKAKRYRC